MEGQRAGLCLRIVAGRLSLNKNPMKQIIVVLNRPGFSGDCFS